MYRISSAAGNRSSVVDEDDQVRFVGTLRECENWLDSQENTRAHESRFIVWARRAWQFLWGTLNDPGATSDHAGSKEAKPPRLAS
jgi:hypothetical protein